MHMKHTHTTLPQLAQPLSREFTTGSWSLTIPYVDLGTVPLFGLYGFCSGSAFFTTVYDPSGVARAISSCGVAGCQTADLLCAWDSAKIPALSP